MSATELRDPPEVWNLLAHDHPKRHVGLATSHALARGKDAHALRVQQQHQQHSRVQRRLAALFASVIVKDRRKIHLLGDIEQEIDEMIGRQPILSTTAETDNSDAATTRETCVTSLPQRCKAKNENPAHKV
jgi:hypothetical protein